MCKFLVYAPDYDQSSGGCICLHSLAEMLKVLGYESFIITNKRRLGSTYSTIAREDDPWRILERSETVVIYPEVVTDNPIDAEVIVRWFLNSPGRFGTPEQYRPNGLQYLYSNMFSVASQKDYMGILRVNDPMLKLYSEADIKRQVRQGTGYIVRKGSHKLQDFPVSPGWLLIEEEISSNESAVVNGIEIFNSLEVFVSYDDATFLSASAAMCGCLSVVIPSKEMTAAEWRKKNVGLMYGIAYGFSKEEISYATETKSLMRKHLSSLLADSYESVDSFASYWNNRISGDSKCSVSSKYEALAAADDRGRIETYMWRLEKLERAMASQAVDHQDKGEKKEVSLEVELGLRELTRLFLQTIKRRVTR